MDPNTIAIWSIVVSGLIGLAGIGATILNSASARAHDERMARERREEAAQQARESAVRERSAIAAGKIVALMQKLGVVYDEEDSSFPGDGGENYDICRELHPEILLLPQPELRDRMIGLKDALWYIGPVAQESGAPLREVGWVISRAGLELMGAFLREESVPAPDSDFSLRQLASYRQIAAAHDTALQHYLGTDEEGESKGATRRSNTVDPDAIEVRDPSREA